MSRGQDSSGSLTEEREKMRIHRQLFGFGVSGLVLLAILGCQPGGEVADETTSRPSDAADVPGVSAHPNDQLPPIGDVQSISSLSEKTVGESVAVQGEIVRQCPAVGCWFQIQDGTGELFVDLNATDIRLTESRVGEHVEVAGRLLKRGGQFQLEAESVEFGPQQ